MLAYSWRSRVTSPDDQIETWFTAGGLAAETDEEERYQRKQSQAGTSQRTSKTPSPFEEGSAANHWWTRGYAYTARIMRAIEAEQALAASDTQIQHWINDGIKTALQLAKGRLKQDEIVPPTDEREQRWWSHGFGHEGRFQRQWSKAQTQAPSAEEQRDERRAKLDADQKANFTALHDFAKRVFTDDAMNPKFVHTLRGRPAEHIAKAIEDRWQAGQDVLDDIPCFVAEEHDPPLAHAYENAIMYAADLIAELRANGVSPEADVFYGTHGNHTWLVDMAREIVRAIWGIRASLTRNVKK